MKLRILHIVSSTFLISALLFTQVGVNFFHRNHDVHENKSVTTPLKSGEAGIQKHDEHCKVCSIDFFNHAFVSIAFILADRNAVSDYGKEIPFSVKHTCISFAQGRAPPVSLS